jgi:hypothetical protein
MIKKVLLVILVFLSVSFSKKNETEVYIYWQQSNSGYWTYGRGFNVYSDFDYMVSRTTYTDSYGFYTYYFWFYSQSYYWDGYRATYTSTNVRNITVHINEGYGLKLTCYDYTPLGVTFFGQYSPTNLRFKSKSRNPYIIMKWNNMSAI